MVGGEQRLRDKLAPLSTTVWKKRNEMEMMWEVLEYLHNIMDHYITFIVFSISI